MNKYICKFLNKIKLLLNLDKSTKEEGSKTPTLEQRIINLEKANLTIIAKLLQVNNSNVKSKVTNKSKLLFASPRDLNEGKTPAYH